MLIPITGLQVSNIANILNLNVRRKPLYNALETIYSAFCTDISYDRIILDIQAGFLTTASSELPTDKRYLYYNDGDYEAIAYII